LYTDKPWLATREAHKATTELYDKYFYEVRDTLTPKIPTSETLSIIVTQRTGLMTTEATLRAILGIDIPSDMPPPQIILIYGCTDDRPLPVCESIQSRLSVIHRFDHYPDTTEARLKGVSLSSGDWLLFIENNVIVPSNLIAKLRDTAIDTGAMVVVPLCLEDTGRIHTTGNSLTCTTSDKLLCQRNTTVLDVRESFDDKRKDPTCVNGVKNIRIPEFHTLWMHRLVTDVCFHERVTNTKEHVYLGLVCAARFYKVVMDCDVRVILDSNVHSSEIDMFAKRWKTDTSLNYFLSHLGLRFGPTFFHSILRSLPKTKSPFLFSEFGGPVRYID
jgi:hypothetical protein